MGTMGGRAHQVQGCVTCNIHVGDSVSYLLGGACVYVEMGEGRSVN